MHRECSALFDMQQGVLQIRVHSPKPQKFRPSKLTPSSEGNYEP
jgi:hypothetical protein